MINNFEQLSEFEINKRVAEIARLNIRHIYANHTMLVESIEKNDAGIGISKYFDPCNDPSDTWPIIEHCWDELNRFVPNGITMVSSWRYLMGKHNCTKLVAACICFLMMKGKE